MASAESKFLCKRLGRTWTRPTAYSRRLPRRAKTCMRNSSTRPRMCMTCTEAGREDSASAEEAGTLSTVASEEAEEATLAEEGGAVRLRLAGGAIETMIDIDRTEIDLGMGRRCAMKRTYLLRTSSIAIAMGEGTTINLLGATTVSPAATTTTPTPTTLMFLSIDTRTSTTSGTEPPGHPPTYFSYLLTYLLFCY